VGYVALANMFLGLLKSGTVLETKSSSQFHILALGVLKVFSQAKA
jgi:hypothetical protein